MDNRDDFQSRVDSLKAEVDDEIEQDRQRRFTMLGFRRGNYEESWLHDFAIWTTVWILCFAALVGAIAIGLGVSIKTALAIAAIALVAAFAFAAMSG